MSEKPTALEDWLERVRRGRKALDRIEAEAAPGSARRGRPRSPEEWDWLRARGVPTEKLGPRWEGDGPVPRLPEPVDEA